MKIAPSLIVFFMSFSLSAASHPQAVLEELFYREFQEKIANTHGEDSEGFAPLANFQQKLFVDALWDLLEEGHPQAKDVLESNKVIVLAPVERLRMGILEIRYRKRTSLPAELVDELMTLLQDQEVEVRLLYTLATYEDLLLSAGHADLISLAKNNKAYFDIQDEETRRITLSDTVIADIFHNSPDTTTYMNGEYSKAVKIFMFCRENRIYPCLMTMRNIYGEVVRNSDGSIWTHRALASSAKGLPSYTRNGNTPAGILTIDSVMPVADQPISFGKYRRMILNFVPKSNDETLLLSLLPLSSRTEDWWKPSVTARDIGRNLFRIHGTGKINPDPTTPYFPFMRTSGCIAQRENTYDGVTYKDQQDLLNTIMTAMDLIPSFENEPKIKGILYLVEIDDKGAPVETEDLSLRGIQ